MVLCRMPEEKNPLYGFTVGVLGGRGQADAFLRTVPRNGKPVHAQETLRKWLPFLWKACEQAGAHEPSFSEFADDARMQWTLQILAGLEPEDRALILMRDQLEWPLCQIAKCFDFDENEARNRLKLARLHFFRQKEVLLHRRKRRP